MTNAVIDAHPLLNHEQRAACKALRNLAKKERRPFTMLEFAEMALRATGNAYAAVTDRSEPRAGRCDNAHRRAAILYVYEAIKTRSADRRSDGRRAGDAATAAAQGTLRDLELLASHGVTK
jgi:hypothetical protein